MDIQAREAYFLKPCRKWCRKWRSLCYWTVWRSIWNGSLVCCLPQQWPCRFPRPYANQGAWKRAGVLCSTQVIAKTSVFPLHMTPSLQCHIWDTVVFNKAQNTWPVVPQHHASLGSRHLPRSEGAVRNSELSHTPTPTPLLLFQEKVHLFLQNKLLLFLTFFLSFVLEQ